MADTNSWRRSLRKALQNDDLSALRRLATDDIVKNQPPGIIAWLGAALCEKDDLGLAADILRQAQQQYPDDFWLNYELAECLVELNDADEALGFARAAVALRPDSQGAQWSLVTALDSAGQVQQSRALFELMLTDSEMSAEDFRIYGSQLLRRGWSEQARLAYEKALEIEPENGIALERMADVLTDLGLFEEGLVYARKAIAIQPDAYLNQFRLAYLLVRNDDELEAEQAYKRALEFRPNSTAALNNLALIMRNGERYAEAAELLRKVLKIRPDYLVARNNLVSVLQAMVREPGASFELRQELFSLQTQNSSEEMLEEAIEDYYERLELNPRDHSYRRRLAGALRSANRWDEAAEQYRILLDSSPGDTSIMVALAYVLDRSSHTKQATEQLRNAVATDPSSYHHRTLAMNLHSLALGRTGDGFQVFTSPQETIELTADQEALIDEAIVHYRLGEAESSRVLSRALISALMQRGRVEEADEVRSSTIVSITGERARSSIEPSTDPRFGSANRLRQEGKLDEAIEVLEEILAEANAEDSVRARANVAMILFEQCKNEEAENILRELINTNTASVATTINLTRILEEQEKFAEALELLEGLLTDEQDTKLTGEVYSRLASVYGAMGRIEDALEAYESARGLNPRSSSSVISLAILFLEQDDRNAALKILRDGFSSIPPILNAVAYCLAVEPHAATPDDLQEALRYATEACDKFRRVRGSPKSGSAVRIIAEYTDTLGLVQYRLGEWEKALKNLQTARNQGADGPDNTIFLAMTHWQLGHREQARQLLGEVPISDLNRVQTACLGEAKELVE